MRLGLTVARPLKVRECADYMGVSSQWIRDAIRTGVPVQGSRKRVKLEAEELTRTRRTYRIHEPLFVAFLAAIGWKHLPVPPPPLTPVSKGVAKGA